MRKLATLLTATITLGGLITSLSAPAYADTWSRPDQRGDVAKIIEGKGNVSLKSAPRNRTTDITRLTVRHNADTVAFDVRVRDLTETITRSVVALIKTPEGLRVVFVESMSFSGVFKQSALAGKRLGTCPRLRKELDYAANVVRIVVPRRCLGNPDWVRVGLQMSTSSQSFRHLAYDQMFVGRLHRKDLTSRPQLSRRIYR